MNPYDVQNEMIMSIMGFMVDMKAEAMTPLLNDSSKLPQCTGEEHIRLRLAGIYACLDYCFSFCTNGSLCTLVSQLVKRVKICVSLCKATQDALLESIL